ncbi:hypothetical protein [Haloarchaeobius sp. DFWS5]|uniref:hypothetical protein n=1 Tax=Haloarchaeobius sp. DFWS5 TaxID=3446114 RepID=UPI003EBA90FF
MPDLSSKHAREVRIAVEVIVLGLLLLGVFHLLLVPAIRSVSPVALEPVQALSRRELPHTVLGWARVVWLLGCVGAYVTWRERDW